MINWELRIAEWALGAAEVALRWIYINNTCTVGAY